MIVYKIAKIDGVKLRKQLQKVIFRLIETCLGVTLYPLPTVFWVNSEQNPENEWSRMQGSYLFCQ